jgi:hypothetical protein
MQSINFSEAWAIRRALMGMEWEGLVNLSPLATMLCRTVAQHKDFNVLTQTLGSDLLTQVLAIDVNSPPPASPKSSVEEVFVAPLPEAAQLSDAALQAGERAGKWLDAATDWAFSRSPMTPKHFLEFGLLWCVGLAVARRAYAHWHAPVYPNTYICWVAQSSIYRKTTGLTIILDIVSKSMDHLLHSEEATPEALMLSLSGKPPSNYDSLRGSEKKRIDRARLFAGQRGLLLDEASSLFGSKKRDYMQGHAEMLMKLYDNPLRHSRETRSEGFLVTYYPSLNILGATTPAALARTTNGQSWEDGELARYILLAPEKILPWSLPFVDPGEYEPPFWLVDLLRRLHDMLPMPPTELEFAAETLPARTEINLTITKDAKAAFDAYSKAVGYDLHLGDNAVQEKLRPNYSRLHVQCAKFATALALMEWAQGGDPNARVTINIGHWARAQQMVERARVDLHRLVRLLDESDDVKAEKKLLEFLRRYPDGQTVREISRGTNLPYKSIEPQLEALQVSGVLEKTMRQNAKGRDAEVWRLTE